MTEPVELFREAAAAMNPIMRGWLWHGADIQLLLNRFDPEATGDEQVEQLAEGCHEWGDMMMKAGLLWWDVRDALREQA